MFGQNIGLGVHDQNPISVKVLSDMEDKWGDSFLVVF
jgi:hypothetical protein